MKTIIYLTFTFLFLTTTKYIFSQILLDFPCYAVSSGELPNVLFEYNPATNEWTEIGITGGTQIKAIATDPVTDIIYAIDKGTFGIIDANTALFTSIGEVGIGNGDAGLIELNDIKGLTYDPINQIMYGTYRVSDDGPGTNDLLFQIDVATGNVITGAMLDTNNNPVDYAVIPEIFDGEFGGDVYDVDDIAYNTYTGQFFALQNQDRLTNTITELNPMNGQVESVILDLTDRDVEGIGFTYLGELYGTIGDDGRTIQSSNTFIFIDLAAGSTTTLNYIDPTGQHTDFEAFDCFTAYNDLALKIEVDPNTKQPINTGETVTFIITIYNQGKFSNSDITITNYIPDGLILSDAHWMDLGNGTATCTVDQVILPGNSVEITVNFIVDPNFIETSLTNSAEIKSSFVPEITPDQTFPPPLPDWDSKPDNENNEVEVTDDEINGGGPNAIQHKDEDDHDIAILQVNSLPVTLTINPELCDTLGAVQVEIASNGTAPFNIRLKKANGSIVHNTSNSPNPLNQISELNSGIYTLIISDAMNKRSIFKIQIPFLSELDGNDNCDNPCPAYLVVPEGEMYGNFKAKEIIEIKGEVRKTKTALFDICN